MEKIDRIAKWTSDLDLACNMVTHVLLGLIVLDIDLAIDVRN